MSNWKTALLQFEILFASVFLLLVVIRYGYMRRFETFQGSVVPVHRYHKRFARHVHAMYLCLVLLPVTGLAIAWLFTQGHGRGCLDHGGGDWSARLLRRPEALIAVHVAAALYSRVKGEGVWTSMVPVFTESGPSTNEYVVKAAAHQAREGGSVHRFTQRLNLHQGKACADDVAALNALMTSSLSFSQGKVWPLG